MGWRVHLAILGLTVLAVVVALILRPPGIVVWAALFAAVVGLLFVVRPDRR